jgi:hypothetical protein
MVMATLQAGGGFHATENGATLGVQKSRAATQEFPAGTGGQTYQLRQLCSARHLTGARQPAPLLVSARRAIVPVREMLSTSLRPGSIRIRGSAHSLGSASSSASGAGPCSPLATASIQI